MNNQEHEQCVDRSEIVFGLVRDLYEADDTREMGRWFWDNHVQWVADTSFALLVRSS